MAKDKKFENVLGKLHGTKMQGADLAAVPKEEAVIPAAKKKKETNRKRMTFFVNEILEEYIDKGTLHEMYRSKSDFVEHILMGYFEGKPYLKK